MSSTPMGSNLLAWAHGVMARRPPDSDMGGHKAWVLYYDSFHPERGLINIHLFQGKDINPVRHDHPYDSVSLCLEGSMVEEYGIPPVTHTRTIKAGDVVYRAAEFTHTIPTNEDAYCLTLYLSGPVVRKMGWYCPQGWVEADTTRGLDVCLGTYPTNLSTEPST